MTDSNTNNNFQAKPKIRIIKVMAKDKNGNIIGELKNDNKNK